MFFQETKIKVPQSPLTVNDKALMLLHKIVYKIAKCRKTHMFEEQLIILVAIDMVETMFGERYPKQFENFTLSNTKIFLFNGTPTRRINDTSV